MRMKKTSCGECYSTVLKIWLITLKKHYWSPRGWLWPEYEQNGTWEFDSGEQPIVWLRPLDETTFSYLDGDYKRPWTNADAKICLVAKIPPPLFLTLPAASPTANIAKREGGSWKLTESIVVSERSKARCLPQHEYYYIINMKFLKIKSFREQPFVTCDSTFQIETYRHVT